MAAPQPYRSTPVFDGQSLPKALRERHNTKAGVWGVIRVIEGELRLTMLEPPGEQVLSPTRSGVIEPCQPHFVTPLGPMRMQVDFYNEPPVIDSPAGD